MKIAFIKLVFSFNICEIDNPCQCLHSFTVTHVSSGQWVKAFSEDTMLGGGWETKLEIGEVTESMELEKNSKRYL